MVPTRIEWNVVVAGAWNLAILTPEGITRRLFGLPPGTPIEVQVPIDRQAPIKVLYSRIVVAPSPAGLFVEPQESSPDELRRAAAIASRALETLPETPVAAAGVNLRFAFDTLPNVLLDFAHSSIDDALADADCFIQTRLLKREIRWREGALNLELLQREGAAGRLQFNFHRESDDWKELSSWVRQSDLMVEAAEKLLQKTFGLKLEPNGEGGH